MADIMVPLPSSINDIGLTPQHTPNGQPFTIKYKNEEYRGISSDAAVTIPGTGITGINLPVLSAEKQSPDLVGIHPKFDGVFGFSYSSLSKHHPPATAIDALYKDGVIPNNEIGIQLCPYEMLQESFINIGNTDVAAKCGTNGKSVAWVQSPSDGYFSVNIKSILVNGKQVDLPEEFQQVVENGRTLYSYLHTCFTYIRFPKTVVDVLINAILDNNAITTKSILFRNKLGKIMIKSSLKNNYLMFQSDYNIDLDKLPTLSIVMFAQTPVTDDNSNSVVTIKLGPRDYMQRYDSKNFVFTVEAGPNDNAVLGASFMTRLAITFDLLNIRIGFGPGCGCEIATDGYPIISNGYQVLWSPSHVRLPEQPSTSGSSGTFIRRRKPTTTTDQVAVPEYTHHTVKSHKQTLNKLD
ncbi:hypothetical protein BDEG_26293 [Batrachochytrium dendrobatidis JEL423]|uniref:Peptidase A1 domain-containing protein n=1 Tax=Batrachochytrium dendrobatidis (strain JEL423) TaxID=403673 RepID=A0A177WU45_BATDL|nr:hypothetical protein BDEG_26293 [Batrachochytrium dendrobatidis JEL423]